MFSWCVYKWLLGVESCTTDTENQKIAVSGSFNLEKLLKKLKKVTGKDVEIVKEEEKDPEPEITEIVKEKDEETEEDSQPEVVQSWNRRGWCTTWSGFRTKQWRAKGIREVHDVQWRKP